MIEAAMFIALGFLAATFLALLTAPALAARADRLARRRLEAQLPRSLVELNAERDHLRAQLALRERRIEQRLEAALSGKQADLAELGRRAVRIEALERDIAERDGRIAGLETDLAETRATLAETREDLSGTRGDLADTREAFAQLKKAHGELTERHDAALQESDARRIAIADLETRLTIQTGRADDFEKRLAERRIELAAERTAHAGTRAALADEQARGEILDRRHKEALAAARRASDEAAAVSQQLREACGERDLARAISEDAHAALQAARTSVAALEARIEKLTTRERALEGAHESALRALNERIEVLKAEKGSLEGALATARQDRARAQAELASRRDPRTLERRAEVADAEIRRANARRAAPRSRKDDLPSAGAAAAAPGEPAREDATTPAGESPAREPAAEPASKGGARA